MPIVSFWSTSNTMTQANTTMTLTAVASALATMQENSYRILVTQTEFNKKDLEGSFFNLDKLTSKGNVDLADTGMDALDRLIRSNKLTAENIANYAKPILKGKLELLFGSFKSDKDSFDRVRETMPIVIEQASKFYDIVLVDLTKGYSNTEINQILQKSDLIVLTISQKNDTLKKFFKDVSTIKILQEKPYITILGKYDKYSKYTAKNIARFYNYKKPIYTIPYNTQFFDACNDGKVVDYFVENINADISTDRNGFFMNETNIVAKAILDALGNKLSER